MLRPLDSGLSRAPLCLAEYRYQVLEVYSHRTHRRGHLVAPDGDPQLDVHW